MYWLCLFDIVQEAQGIPKLHYYLLQKVSIIWPHGKVLVQLLNAPSYNVIYYEAFKPLLFILVNL